jgi:hypothetical protein
MPAIGRHFKVKISIHKKTILLHLWHLINHKLPNQYIKKGRLISHPSNVHNNDLGFSHQNIWSPL